MNFPSYMRIAVLQTKHIIKLNETAHGKVSFTGGIEAEIVQILARYLDFRYKLFTPKDGEWGVLNPGGNWTGLLGMVNRSEVDMGICFLTITEERNNAVTFVPYHTDSTTFAASSPENSPNAFYFLDPFDNSVWLLCLLVLMVLPLLFCIFQCIFQKKCSYHIILLKMAGYFVNQPARITCSTAGEEYLLSSWKIFTRLMTLSYTVVLLSFMTVPLRAKGIETIKELAKAVSEGTHRCYASKGASEHEFMLKSSDDSLQYLGHAIERRGWMLRGEVDPNQIEQNMAVIGFRSMLKLERDSDVVPNFFLFEENIANWHAGIALRKSFCCARKLSRIIGRMRSAGIYEKLYNEEVNRTKMLKYKLHVSQVGEISQSMKHVYGTFVLLFIGLAFSTLVFACEVIVNLNKGKIH